MAMNWFEKNIRNGRVVTPWDINKRPRQYRIWSGRKDFYPVNTDSPKFLRKKVK